MTNVSHTDGEHDTYCRLDANGVQSHDAVVKHMAESHRSFGRLARILSLILISAAVLLVLLSVFDMLPIMEARKYEWYALLASIPIVALLFTWFHIWLAIQMMFMPIQFVGIWEYGRSGLGIGWQGVIPRKAGKMASTAFECGRYYLEGPGDWFRKVNIDILSEKVRPHTTALVRTAFASVGNQLFPEVFRVMPSFVREEIVLAAVEKIEQATPAFWSEVAVILADKDDGIDNDQMIVSAFTANKALLNHFFQRLGYREFRFIEHCGAALGLLCGFLQLLAYNYLEPRGRMVLLPVSGFFLGIFTNWVAILMCFWPIDPVRLESFYGRSIVLQGLFLKRQPEVCAVYSNMVVDYFFNFTNIIAYLQTRPALWSRLKGVFTRHFVVALGLELRPKLVPYVLAEQEYRRLQEGIQNELVDKVAEATEMHRTIEETVSLMTDLKRTNTRRLQSMPPKDFENLLHPAFKEDEWILVLVGGVLGAVVGFSQIIVLGSNA